MAKLCKAGQQLREQFDDSYPDRNRRSDGVVGDPRHVSRKSDHNPDADGWVFAIDITADLNAHPEEMHTITDDLRKLAKRGDRRIKYIIYDGRICSSILNWKWRKYTGPNPHRSHAHFSFTRLGKNDSTFFQIPLLGGTEDAQRPETSSTKLGKDISSSSTSDLPSGRVGCRCNCQCCNGISLA
jgi:hypothetical protein